MIWGSSPLRLSTILAGFTSSSVVFTSCADTSSMVGEVRPVSDLQYISEDSDNALLFCLKSTTGHWFDMAGLWMVTNCLLGFGIKLNDPCEPILIDPPKDQGGGGSPGFRKVFSTFHSFHAYGVFCIFVQRKKNVASGTFPPQPDSHTRPYWRQFPSVKDEGPSQPKSFQAIQKPSALQIRWPF